MPKIKHRGEFMCTVIGWRDRLFRQVILDDDGKTLSGFIKSRHALFHDGISKAVTKLISAQSESRIKADKIIARLSDEDINLIKGGAKNIHDSRKLKVLTPQIETLVSISATLKSERIKFQAELEAIGEDIERQLTAYLLAAFSRKKNVDIKLNSKVDYENTNTYQTFITAYADTDKVIEMIIASIKNNETAKNEEKGGEAA